MTKLFFNNQTVNNQTSKFPFSLTAIVIIIFIWWAGLSAEFGLIDWFLAALFFYFAFFIIVTLIDLSSAIQLYILTLPLTHSSVTIFINPAYIQLYYFLGAILLIRWCLTPSFNHILLPRVVRWTIPFFFFSMAVSIVVTRFWLNGAVELLKWIFNFFMMLLFVNWALKMKIDGLRWFLKQWFKANALLVLIAMILFISPLEYFPNVTINLSNYLKITINQGPQKIRTDTGESWASLALGLGNDYTPLAGTCMIGGLIGLGLLFGKRNIEERLYARAFLIVLIIGLIMTLTRSAWLGTLTGMLILLWERVKKRIGALLAIFVLVLTASMFSNIQERFSITFAQQSTNRDTRLELWYLLLDSIEKNPVFGMGPRQAQPVVTWRAIEMGSLGEQEIRTAAHNPYLTLWAEYGSLTFLSFILIITAIIRKTFHVTLNLSRTRYEDRNLGIIFVSLFIAWNIFAFFNPLFYPWFWILCGFCLGFCMIISLEAQKNSLAIYSKRNK